MPKEVQWRGSSREDVARMPAGVQKQFHAKLRYMANGTTVSGIKSWSGIGPHGKELSSGGYRLVLTTEFSDAVHALHAFKKDSKRGRATRGRHVSVVEERYKTLAAEYAARSRKQ
jgi:phage-related protein